METIVIALGGNALLNPSSKQSISSENININRVCKSIAKLYKSRRCRIVITHGNGTQFGDELIRNEHAKRFVPKLPLYMLNAETQASIGTLIELSMRNALSKEGLKCNVSTIIAHVKVNAKDSAFKRPSKPIGPFYTKQGMEREMRLHRFDYVKQKEGYRMVIASPKPISILESETISSESRKGMVITCGGGGIPVVMEGKKAKGVDAVIDKDRTSGLLANKIGADKLIILTNADYVYSDYKNKRGRIISIRSKTLRGRLGRFEDGTIRPKLEACVDFIENGGKEAFIGNAFRLGHVLNRKSGTEIY